MKPDTEPQEIKKAVRQGYRRIAERIEQGGCGCGPSCCGGGVITPEALSGRIGYTEREMRSVPEGANLGLGCGNPLALASIREGETVLDLGSGAGFDAFLAAERVGESGRVIGVDMTLEMVARARANAEKGGYRNVEFRLGEIEHLPVESDSVDLVISNCVINLVPDKEQAFREAYRVLKPGGRLAVSDVVLTRPLPEELLSDIDLYIGCVAGAMLKEDYLEAVRRAGFEGVEVVSETAFSDEALASEPETRAAAEAAGGDPVLGAIRSITVRAVKPEGGR